MRPNALPPDLKLAYLPPLPPNRTLIRVYADFLAYLMTCAEKFIRDTYPIVSTPESWSELRRTATFVLSHPNGWEGPHQSKLRQAVIMARFVPDSADSHSRIIFVSEGEASLHYCLRGGGFVEGVGVSTNYTTLYLCEFCSPFSSWRIVKVVLSSPTWAEGHSTLALIGLGTAGRSDSKKLQHLDVRTIYHTIAMIMTYVLAQRNWKGQRLSLAVRQHC